jgi:hypothetical protein
MVKMRKTPAFGGALLSTRTLAVSKHRNQRKSGKTTLVARKRDPVSTKLKSNGKNQGKEQAV